MLASTTSRELAEWAAYERYAGPLDNSWRDECLASIQERLQELSYFFSEKLYANTKKGTHGPVPKPERYPRPWETSKQDPTKEDAGDEGPTPYQVLWPSDMGGNKD